MKKEQYDYINELFNLEQYNQCNGPDGWIDVVDIIVDVSKLVVDYNTFSNEYAIRTHEENPEYSLYIYIRLPTEELAKDVLQAIKDTEIMFV